MVRSCGELRRFGDGDSLARTIAGEIASRLTRACAERGRASLVVSGGRSPIRLFQELRSQPLDWSRLFITQEALQESAPAGCAAMWSPSAPHERVSLNLSALLDSRHIFILILGEQKLAVHGRACAAGPVEEMPVRGILRQARVPVDVIWAPTRDSGQRVRTSDLHS